MDQSPRPPNRRRSRRLPAHMAAQYTSAHTQTRTAVAFELSPQGAFVRSDVTDAPGTMGSVRITTYMARQPIAAQCRVVHTNDAGMGLEFTNTDAHSQKLLRRYCDRFCEAPRILMVDDEAPILRMMGRFLEGAGYKFVGIDLPVTTESIIERFVPDLVVLDMMMPGVGGICLAARLRQNPTTHDVPLVFFSSSAAELLPGELQDVPFLSKSASRDAILAAIRAALDGNTPLHPKV